MSKDAISDYSATANSNTDVGGVNINEGCAPSTINNAIREVMSHLADLNAGSSSLGTIKVDNLQLDANAITSTDTNGDIAITPNGTGDVVIDGLKHPQADGTANYFLKTDGSAQLSFAQVDTASIAADAIDGTKIADDAINSEHYTDGSIDTAHIADDQITQAKMANDSIGADELASNAVVNASVASGAAIAFSKMANLTTGRALVSDGSGDVSVSAVTATEIGHLDGVTSAIQTQIDAKTTATAASNEATALAIALG